MLLPAADRVLAPQRFSGSHSCFISALVLFVCCFSAVHSGAQSESPDQSRRISGTVINSITSAPIPRALVTSNDNRFAKLTDGEGHFEITVPSENVETTGVTVVSRHARFSRCWLAARKPGFLYDCSDQGSGARSSADNVTIALVPEGIIHGRVTVTNTDILSGTTVELYVRDVVDGLPRWMHNSSARTNSLGEFRFAELPAGEYKLLTDERADDDPIANAGGKMYGYPPVFYPAAANFDSAGTIHLSAGQSIQTELSAVRQSYYRVNIPVVDSDINSGMNVTVRAQSGPGYSLGYNPMARRIEGFLPNGNYLVQGTMFGPNLASGVVNLRVNGATADGSPMILVPASSITLNVKEEFTDTSLNESTLRNSGKSIGAVRGPRSYLNASVEGADDLQEMRGGSLRPPTGPTDTSIVLENLLPGRYWLRLYPSRGYVASARMGNLDLLHQPFDVATGVGAPIEIEMRDDTAELDGTIVGVDFPPVGPNFQYSEPAAWIYCVPLPDSSGRYQELAASPDGKFAHSMMVPGAYRILTFARQQMHLPYRDPEAMKAYETKGQVVRLSAGQKVTVQVPLIADTDASER